MSIKAILAAVVGAIAAFLLNWLVFGILTMGFYTANTTYYDGLMKEMPDLVLFFFSTLVWGFFYAFIFERWKVAFTFWKGFVAGIIISLPVTLAYDLYLLGSMNLFNPVVLLLDVPLNTLVSAVVAGLIAWIIGYERKEG